MSDEPKADPVTKVARDLTAITEMAATLHSQALAKSDDKLMPGGLAMVALGPEADLAEWGELVAAAELYHFATCSKASHRDCTVAEHVNDEDDQFDEPPLQTLLFWAEDWREHHGYPLGGRKPTLVTEAAFIRWALDWAWDNEPKFEDMARDINQVRRRLESVLHAGSRAERTRVPCINERCETKPRLIKVYGDAARGDRYRCPACKHYYEADEFLDAYRKQLRSEGAAKFVPKADAIDVITRQGTAKRTIHRWLEPHREEADQCEECGRMWPHQEFAACPFRRRRRNGDLGEPCGGELHKVWVGDEEDVIEGFCEVSTRRTLLWWPDLWRTHLAKLAREALGKRDGLRKSA